MATNELSESERLRAEIETRVQKALSGVKPEVARAVLVEFCESELRRLVLCEVERRFLVELQTHIDRARSGVEPSEAVAVLGAFCTLVERDMTPPLALLRHLASAFRTAMRDAEPDKPATIDPRKALGLVRASAGNPHRKPPLTPDEAAELAADPSKRSELFALADMPYKFEKRVRTRVKFEQEVEIGMAVESQFRAQIEEAARANPKLVERALDAAVTVVQQRFTDQGVTLSAAKVRRAHAALL